MPALARRLLASAGGMLIVLLNGLSSTAALARDYPVPVPAPAFTQKSAEGWINSPPLTWRQLTGRVVLLDIWTFGCANCYRSFPWLKSLQARFGSEGLTLIGIHTPEFNREKNRTVLERKVREFDLTHPVMMDNDYAYWRALANSYWPTFYLVDKQGRIRAHFIGETHPGDARAQAIERRIQKLLVE